MKNVLIIGANGFVGQALSNRMLAENWHVRGTVRSETKAEQLPAGVEPVYITNVWEDRDWADMYTGMDVVIYLAARSHIVHDVASDPLFEFRQVNVIGAEHSARMAAANGAKRFIYISSVKVNGEESKVPYSENMPADPQDPYGISKWEAEQAVLRIGRETGLDVVIIRPPLVYGPGVKANFLSLMDLVYKAIPLPLAEIKNLRSFIYVENLVDIILLMIKHPDAAGKTYLVSDGKDMSTPDLIRVLAEFLDRPVRLFPAPLCLIRIVGRILGKSYAVERLVGSLIVDSSRVQTELGWNAPYSMGEGLRKTVNWYKESCL